MFHGFAHVGNCDNYYLITRHGIHYCDQERIGLFKKQHVSRFFALEPVESIDVETRPDIGSAYIGFLGGGKMPLYV